MAYGFTITADEHVIATMNKIERQMEQLTAKIDSQSKEIQNSFKAMGETAKEVANWIGEAFAIREIYEFGKEIMHVTAEFEAFQNVIKYSSRSVIDSEDNISYLEGAIRRLHMPMREAYQGFSEMQAGLIGTGIEGERLRKLFEGISTAATVLHLPTHALEMTLYDFKEIGERGLNMRNMRSLMGWLPGISEIVKETFHKTFQELEQEHMGGPEFLNKLSGGLQKHFAPGLGNAGNSLQSAINDTTTAFQKLERELGEKLRPLFIEIMRNIRAAFDSGLVKSFINNIRPLVEGLITMVKLWLEYKAGIYAVKLIEEARIAVLSAMALAQGKLTLQTEAGAQSLKGFQEGLNSFKWGLFAMGIGSAIELLMKFQAHTKAAKQGFEDMLEENSHAKAIQAVQGQNAESIETIRAGMKDSGLMKSQSYRDDLFNRTQNLISLLQSTQAETVAPALKSASYYADSSSRSTTPADVLKSYDDQKSIAQSQMAASEAQIKAAQELLAQLKKQGAHAPNYTAGIGDNITGGALQTVNLAGAQGGLGAAKIINIHVDTMQKVSVGTPDGLKRAGQDAVEVMLRALNNIGYGQSQTQ